MKKRNLFAIGMITILLVSCNLKSSQSNNKHVKKYYMFDYNDHCKVVEVDGPIEIKGEGEEWYPLGIAIRDGNEEEVQRLLEKNVGMDEVYKDEIYVYDAPYVAVSYHQHKLLRDLLFWGARPDGIYGDFFTDLLTIAAAQDDIVSAEILLRAGLNPDGNSAKIEGEAYYTPLIHAIEKKNVEMVRLLKRYGVDHTTLNLEDLTSGLPDSKRYLAKITQVLNEETDLSKGIYEKIRPIGERDEIFYLQGYTVISNKECGFAVLNKKGEKTFSRGLNGSEQFVYEPTFYKNKSSQWPYIICSSSGFEYFYNTEVYLLDKDFNCTYAGEIPLCGIENSESIDINDIMKVTLEKGEGVTFTFDADSVIYDNGRPDKRIIQVRDLKFTIKDGKLQPNQPLTRVYH